MATEPQRFCLGIAYEPGQNPRITKGADGGRDYFTEAELEKAAWSYLRNGPRVNAFHVAGTEGCATTVESSIYRGPDWDLGDGIVVRKGTWLVGAILDERMWQAAQDGKVNGWSPEGTARRRRVRKGQLVPIAKSALPADDGEEFTELVDADFPTMGLVGKGANGIPRFLVMKDADGEASGLLDPEFVRDLIAKAEPDPEPTDATGQVTMTGSPAAIAAFIHKASVRQAVNAGSSAAEIDGLADAAERAADALDVAKAEMSAKSQNDLPDSDFAYIEPGGEKDADGKTTPRSLRHFNISDAAHTRNALARLSSSPFGDKASGKVHAAAKKFGIQVSKEAGVPDTVAKDMGPELDDGIDQLDPTVPLCAPDEDAPGDPTDPGSPAWEAIDAATAQKWTSIAVRLKNALSVMAEREMLEAASADPCDAENAFDLEDAMCAVDYVIDTLAGFAVDEQAEADLGGEAMEAVGKSAGERIGQIEAGIRADATRVASLTAIRKAMADEGLPAALATVETFGAIVRKSGRVLSAVNEAHLREAHARLNTVLSSLPAPTADDGQQVAKMTPAEEASMPEATPSEDATAASGQQPAMGTREAPAVAQTAVVTKSALALVYDRAGAVVGVTDAAAVLTQVAKADDGEKKPMQAVFDQDGDLIGIVDPDAIQPVTGAGGKPADGDASDGSDDGAAAPDASDMTPQPPAEAGTPADDVAKGTQPAAGQDPDTRTVLKSIVTEALAEVLGAQGTAQDVAKQADVAALGGRLEDMLARLETVEKQDARPGVFANGAVPPPDAIPPARPSLRGQDQGAGRQVDVTKARERKAELYAADAPQQAVIAKEMQQDAVAYLEAMHAAR